MATAGALAHRAMGHFGVQPPPQACVAGIPGGLLAEDTRTAERGRVGQERAVVSARFSRNDRDGEESAHGSLRENSTRRRANDFAPSAGAGGPQPVSPGAVSGFPPVPGPLADPLIWGRFAASGSR